MPAGKDKFYIEAMAEHTVTIYHTV